MFMYVDKLFQTSANSLRWSRRSWNTSDTLAVGGEDETSEQESATAIERLFISGARIQCVDAMSDRLKFLN